MKIGLYADPHFALSSSIIMGTSGSTSGRLDSLIRSFEWMYKYFKDNKIELSVGLGDMTNSPHLRAEEISALYRALSFRGDLPEYHILGNHETITGDGKINSVALLGSDPSVNLIISPEVVELGNTKVLFLPYSDYDEEKLSRYSADVVFSHVNIKESYVGNNFVLRDGVSPDFLSKSFKLVVNGHVHSGSWVRDNVLNLGSLSGLNFSSLGGKWNPSIGILDMDTLDVKLIENPYAIRFLTVDIEAIVELKKALSSIEKPEFYAVQVKVPYDLREDARELLSNLKVGFYRIVSKLNSTTNSIQKTSNFERVNSVEEGFKLMGKYLGSEGKSREYDPKDIYRVLNDAYKGEFNNI